MDRFKIEVSSPCPCQCWQRFPTSGSGSVEPLDELLHLSRNLFRWRCLKMNLRCSHCAGDNLHWLSTDAVSADIGQILPAAHQHAMPFAQHLIRKWRRKGLVETDHHLRNAAFRGRSTSLVGCQSQLPLDG